MDSDVWGVLARRFATGTFLRRVFPLLLAWLERGVGDGNDGVSVGNEEMRCCCRRVSTAAAVRGSAEGEGGTKEAESRREPQGQERKQGERAGGEGYEPEQEPTQEPEQEPEQEAKDRVPQTRERGRKGHEARAAAAGPTSAFPRNDASSGEEVITPTTKSARPSRMPPPTWNGVPGRRGGGGGRGSGGRSGGGGSAASGVQVQVAAAASLSQGVFECLGESIAESEKNWLQEPERREERGRRGRGLLFCGDRGGARQWARYR